MLFAIHGVKHYAHCYTWSEAIYSMINKERSYMILIDKQGEKLCAHCYSWNET